jgi:hypothetical protein
MNPLEMDPGIRARWVAALRSGEYPQAHQQLRDGDGRCCLGVLCELAVEDGVIAPPYMGGGAWVYDGADTDLPETVWRWAGLDSGNPEAGEFTLIELNDDEHWDFAEIADAIEGVTL